MLHCGSQTKISETNLIQVEVAEGAVLRNDNQRSPLPGFADHSIGGSASDVEAGMDCVGNLSSRQVHRGGNTLTLTKLHRLTAFPQNILATHDACALVADRSVSWQLVAWRYARVLQHVRVVIVDHVFWGRTYSPGSRCSRMRSELKPPPVVSALFYRCSECALCKPRGSTCITVSENKSPAGTMHGMRSP